jgi:hypothetical protein
MHKLLATSLALALAAPCSARADTASDLSALRQEIESMRAAYEARLQALEQRLRQAEAAAATPPPAATVAGGAAPAAPEPARSADAVPAVVAASGGSTGFNPSISLILSGLYTRTSRDPANYSIGGFPLPPGAEIGPGTRGLSLTESELGFAASIDPWLRGAANISLHADDSVSVEEAYVQTTSIGNGLSLKAGRFFSGVGYLNPQHSHTWDFVDNPLAYQAMLGTQYGDDGVQLTWLAPTDQYVEIGVELGRGRTFPGDGASRNGVGMASLFAHTGGDIGDSHSWRAGLSVLNAKANAQDLLVTNAASAQIESRFTGRTRVWIADAIWKWSPHGNATRTNFKLQGEYLRSTRSGSLVDDVASAPDAGRYRVVQSGWYLQGIYQFVPHWRIGLRTERLDSGNPDHDPNATAFAATDDSPRKNSLMIDYSPSEFSRVRLQLARDRARADGSDNQIFLQYQMSLGAHGAHSY